MIWDFEPDLVAAHKSLDRFLASPEHIEDLLLLTQSFLLANYSYYDKDILIILAMALPKKV